MRHHLLHVADVGAANGAHAALLALLTGGEVAINMLLARLVEEHLRLGTCQLPDHIAFRRLSKRALTQTQS